MRRLALVLLFLPLAGCGKQPATEAPPAPDTKPADTEAAAKRDLQALQGEWAAVGGPPGTPFDLFGAGLLLYRIEGNKITTCVLSAKGGEKDRQEWATFTLAPGAKPKRIDLTYTSGPNKGRTSAGIYLLHEGSMALNVGTPGKDRPARFGDPSSAAGDFVFTMVDLKNARLLGPVGPPVDDPVRLPPSRAARPLDKAEEDQVLYLNLVKGRLHQPGLEPLESVAEVAFYLRQQAHDYRERAKLYEKQGKKPGELTVVLRPDRKEEYGWIYRVARECNAAGMRRFRLRAAVPVAKALGWPDDDERLFLYTKTGTTSLEGWLDFLAPSPKAQLTVKFQTRPGKPSVFVLVGPKGEVQVEDRAGLEKQLQNVRKGLTNQADITLAPDGPTLYEDVAAVTDAGLGAGFSRVGLAPPAQETP